MSAPERATRNTQRATRTADPLLEQSGVSGDDLAEVLAMLAGTDIAELDVTIGARRLNVRRPPVIAPSLVDELPTLPAEPLPLAIASPLVGIFRPAVRTGDTVQLGQSIGSVEALGMPASVDAPHSGTVEELLVRDGSPVEYGQPLLTLRRAAGG
jgi:acetyl-CoA carboxylase biotin carboxyl carrier protein